MTKQKNFTEEVFNELIEKIDHDCIYNSDSGLYNKYMERDEKGQLNAFVDFLDMQDGNVDTLELNRKQYGKFEEICEKEEYNKDYGKFSISISYDISGYDYWNVQQEEPNYCNFTITVFDPDFTEADFDLIRNLNRKFVNELSDIK